MTALDVVVKASGVRWSYPTATGPHEVLRGIDLTAVTGEVLAVAGRSGSGKTTLLSILAGWEDPSAGSVEVLGRPADPDRPWSDAALVPQALGLLEELTVAENIGLPLRLSQGGESHEPAELMEQLGLTRLADRYPSQTSLGEQQRTALARAAVVRPRLLLADEPVSHQNREWAEAALTVLDRLASDGSTCLLATHDEVALAAAHRVFHVVDGRLSESRVPSAPGHPGVPPSTSRE